MVVHRLARAPKDTLVVGSWPFFVKRSAILPCLQLVSLNEPSIEQKHQRDLKVHLITAQDLTVSRFEASTRVKPITVEQSCFQPKYAPGIQLLKGSLTRIKSTLAYGVA